jgi:hypothetical protein
MWRALILVFIVVCLTLVACGSDDDKPSTVDEVGPFDWNHAADAVVVRLDSQLSGEAPAFALNSIPVCTVWGDGRVVWTTRRDDGSEDVLEARITDNTMREFIANIIAQGLYTWEDEIPPSSAAAPVIESITLALTNQTKTVQRYNVWPHDGFGQILSACQQLSAQPVRVLPEAGYISAFAVERDTTSPTWLWPDSAPFTLSDLATSGDSRWLEGNLAVEVWMSARADRGDIQVLDSAGGAYQIAIVVPEVSRDAPPAAE